METLKASSHRQTLGLNHSLAISWNGCKGRHDEAGVRFCCKNMWRALPLQSTLVDIMRGFSHQELSSVCPTMTLDWWRWCHQQSSLQTLPPLLHILSTYYFLPLMASMNCISSAVLAMFPYILVFNLWLIFMTPPLVIIIDFFCAAGTLHIRSHFSPER